MAKVKQHSCEYMPGGLSDLMCEIPTNLEIVFDGGQPVSMCLAHILLEIQDLMQPAPGGETIDNVAVRRI